MVTDNEKHADIILIDLSSVAHPIWHNIQGDPSPTACTDAIVARVREMANGHKHVAICCDSGVSFRRDINAAYKANRPEKNETLVYQIKAAIEILRQDGFPIWQVRSFEADDIIATAVKLARARDLTVVIRTADKDLAQLVSEHVVLKKVADGSVLDVAGVQAKFGVKPEQMRDFLTLCGDTSDNVQGAKGIGVRTAAELLTKHGSLDALYEVFDKRGGASMGLKPSIAASLKEFKDSGTFPITRQLITMKDDVPIPFEELAAERVPTEGSPLADTGDSFAGGDDEQEDNTPEEGEINFNLPPTPPPDSSKTVWEEPAKPVQSSPAAEGTAAPGSSAATSSAPQPTSAPPPKPPQALARIEPDSNVVDGEIVYERQLDPRNLRSAQNLALDMHKSNMFSAYGNKEAVLSTVLLGRELGLPAMASLRAVHVIDGKHSLSADAMVALVLKSGLATYFKPVKWSATEATWETHRKDGMMGDDPIAFTYTIEMAQQAGLVKEKEKSNWKARPMEMCMARAKAILARMVYGDLLGGLYTPEELRELTEGQ